MKKFLALLLLLSFVLSLCGCGALLYMEEPEVIFHEGEWLEEDPFLPEEEDATEAATEESPSYAEVETEQSTTELPPTDTQENVLDPDGWYYSVDDVSLYLFTYGVLPQNFITKSEARDLGWEGGSVEYYAPGCAIGGDTFGNREGLLPEAEGRIYYECDIDTDGSNSRGAKRIVFSNDGLIYYTEDHYESFTLLYGEEFT